MKNNSGGIMNTILQLHSKVVTSVILITSIVGLLISIYDPLPEYYGTAVSVAIWVFSLWVLKRIRNFYIAGKETTTIEKKFDFVAFFVCFPVVTYLAPQISSYQIDGVTSGCFGILFSILCPFLLAFFGKCESACHPCFSCIKYSKNPDFSTGSRHSNYRVLLRCDA